jgi:hypothetical protein
LAVCSRVAAAHDCEDIQPFSSFFTAVAGENVSFTDEKLLTNEGSAPSSTCQFDLVVNNVG